jgi:hypothetical protein
VNRKILDFSPLSVFSIGTGMGCLMRKANPPAQTPNPSGKRGRHGTDYARSRLFGVSRLEDDLMIFEQFDIAERAAFYLGKGFH